MEPADWIFILILGGILGVCGQVMRVVIGLKKIYFGDKPMKEVFEGRTLGTSLLIGFVAGVLAIIGVTKGTDASTLSREIIIAIIGAGYSGTDFIEGLIKR